jgi:hypothetical protein
MTQQELADLLKDEGFTACCKAAVSLAERSDVSGVQFTKAAREAAQMAVKQARGAGQTVPVIDRTENRKNGRKTTVWLDDETRAWLEQKAWMEDTNVGEIIRKAVKLLRGIEEKAKAPAVRRPQEQWNDVGKDKPHHGAMIAQKGIDVK